MKATKILCIAHSLFTLLCSTCQAEDINGTWKLSKSVDYENLDASPPNPPSTTIHVINHTLILPSNCFVTLHPQKYSIERPFQMLLKSGESEAAIGQFMLKQFNIRLNASTTYYRADPADSCNTLGSDFLLTQEKLTIIRASFLFHAFTKTTTNVNGSFTPKETATIPGGLKPSLLPFSVSSYMAQCAGNLQTKKGIPQSTSKCAPAYFPYVASKASTDQISKLVGSHFYYKGGARNGTNDYDNPVANGLHPIFVIFPPLGDVFLIRVDDMERAETRDVMGGVYLSIKDNRVIDQLNAGCDFDSSYICSTSEHEAKHQLTKNGKFLRRN